MFITCPSLPPRAPCVTPAQAISAAKRAQCPWLTGRSMRADAGFTELFETFVLDYVGLSMACGHVCMCTLLDYVSVDVRCLYQWSSQTRSACQVMHVYVCIGVSVHVHAPASVFVCLCLCLSIHMRPSPWLCDSLWTVFCPFQHVYPFEYLCVFQRT